MTETVECCDVQRFDTKKIEALLHSGSLKSCRETVDSYLAEIRFSELRSLMLRLYVVMDLYIVARSFTKEIGISNEQFIREFGSIDEISSRLQTNEGTVSFIHTMFEQCIRWRIETASGCGNEIVRKAAEYIDRHYMDADLTLKAVADAVGLSAPYFSTVFKREMQINFTDYLTNVRIAHAKALLGRTSKLISEVAFEVGFRDYRYFSQIFKKQTGQTPRQFQACVNLE